MAFDLLVVQILVEERAKEALGWAERGRLVRMSRKSKGIRPFLLATIQRLRDWWDCRGSHSQPATDNMKQRQRRQNWRVSG